MRQLLIVVILAMLGLSGFTQDKIYLNDNSLLEGIIVNDNDKKIEFVGKDKSRINILKSDIAMIVYENGFSEVMGSQMVEEDKRKIDSMSEWMLGTNLLLPLDRMLGFTIEKKVSKRYYVRVGQAFQWDNYFGFGFITSLHNNFYIGNGKIKWLNSVGLNMRYSENRNYYPINSYYYYEDLILPYRPHGMNSDIDLDFTFGTGVYIDVTKHLGFSTQLFFCSSLRPEYSSTEYSLFNSGFYLFYKF
jgi:hypothetical protein